MKKFNAVNKRNEKEFIVIIEEGKETAITIEKVSGKEKEVSMKTIKRWFILGEEIVEVKEEEKKEEIVVVVEEKKVEKKKAAKKSTKKSVSKKMTEEERIAKAQRPAEERAVKKDGEARSDKFRPKLNVEQVLEIRAKYREGAKKSHLAEEYGVSFRTITCIVEYIMWKHVS